MSIIALLRGLGGILLLLAIAFLFSNNRRKINWRLVGSGLLIQVIFAIFILYAEPMRRFFFPLGWPKDLINALGKGVVSLLNFTI